MTNPESALTVSVPRLPTPRLVLRAFQSRDYPDYAVEMADPEATRFTARPAERAVWWSFAAASGGWVLDGAGWWAVELRETGRAIGLVGVFVRETAPEDFEIGWAIYRAHWRKGYAVEAARAALDYAFEGHRASKVIAHIDQENVASVAVGRKIGLVYEKDVDFFDKKIGRYLITRDQRSAAERG